MHYPIGHLDTFHLPQAVAYQAVVECKRLRLTVLQLLKPYFRTVLDGLQNALGLVTGIHGQLKRFPCKANKNRN